MLDTSQVVSHWRMNMGMLFPSNPRDPECVCRRVCQAMNGRGYRAAVLSSGHHSQAYSWGHSISE